MGLARFSAVPHDFRSGSTQWDCSLFGQPHGFLNSIESWGWPDFQPFPMISRSSCVNGMARISLFTHETRAKCGHGDYLFSANPHDFRSKFSRGGLPFSANPLYFQVASGNSAPSLPRKAQCCRIASHSSRPARQPGVQRGVPVPPHQPDYRPINLPSALSAWPVR